VWLVLRVHGVCLAVLAWEYLYANFMLNILMQDEFIIVQCDVHCKWDHANPPRYRCFVNDELFTERTWIWTDMYLEENLQISAPPGDYTVRFELVSKENAGLKIRNMRIKTGPAIINREGVIQIYTPEITQ